MTADGRVPYRRETVNVDGDPLAYASYGDPDGRPVMALHGTPGSRRFGALFEDAARERAIRVVAPDRPGYGDSPSRERELTDWPGTAAALADALSVEEFGVLGFSGGAPFAFATAAALPGRVRQVAVVAGVAPPAAPHDGLGVGGRALRAVGHKAPSLLGPPFRLSAAVARRRGPAATLGPLTDEPVGDVAVADGTTVGDVVHEGFLTALSDTTAGLVREQALFVRPWGFDLGDVEVPVALWHGTADDNVPVAAGRWVAEALADCDARFVDHDHLGTLVAALEDALAAAARGGDATAP